MRTSIISFTVICVVLTANAGLFAEVINVPDDFETIQAGINAAEDGDTVLVQPGEYTERINFFGRDIVLSSLYLLSHNWESVNETSIVSSDNGSIVTFSNGESEDAELVGFTITSDPNDHFRCNEGSGIYCNNANPTIIACIITNQSATFRGGGIFIDGDCSVTIMDCQFLGNEAGFAGGGAYLGHGAAATFTRCYFYENISWDWESNPGNAIFLGESAATLNFCTIANSPIERLNSYMAIMLVGSDLNVSNSVIWTGWDMWITSRHDWRVESSCTIRYSDLENGREAIGRQNLELIYEDNIEDDPLYIDNNGGNHHLSVDSPCIDAGDPDSPRDPDGTRADMGAYYFHQDLNFELSADSLHFDGVLIDSSRYLTLTISNLGDAELEINAVETDNEAFTHSFAADTVVQPEGDYELTITFSPDSVREYTASLVITANDYVNREITISLSGSGVELGAVEDDFILHPSSFILSSHPNPFNSSTTITYGLPVPSEVFLRLYDMSGRDVRTLFEGNKQPGVHTTTLFANDLPSGLYFVRLETSSNVMTRKVILVR